MLYTLELIRAVDLLVRGGMSPRIVAKLLDIPEQSVDVLAYVSTLPDDITRAFLKRKLTHNDILIMKKKQEEEVIEYAHARITHHTISRM